MPAAKSVTTGLATATHIAAEDVGIVSKIPIIAEIIIPIKNGVAFVAIAISFPNCLITHINGHAAKIPTNDNKIIPRGIRIISNLVFPAYKLAISIAIKATT